MLLRKDDPWPEELGVPDVRNWRVVDVDENPIGFVESVVIDFPNKSFESIVTGPNEKFPAGSLGFRDGVVVVKNSVAWRVPATEDGSISYTSFDEAFRKHAESVYPGSDYRGLSDAYRFGRRMALDGDFAGRSYESAEEDLRSRYVTEQRQPPYNEIREAVRFAFDLAHGARTLGAEGLEREDSQILNPSHLDTDDSERAGAHMGTGRPETRPRSS